MKIAVYFKAENRQEKIFIHRGVNRKKNQNSCDSGKSCVVTRGSVGKNARVSSDASRSGDFLL